MNQGYEVVEFVQGNRIKPADEDLLQAKFDLLKNKPRVSVALRVFKTGAIIGRPDHTAAAEFFLDSDIRTAKKGDYIFRKDDYSDTFFSIIVGSVEIETSLIRARP